MSVLIDFNADFGEGFSVYPFPMQVWRAKLENEGILDSEINNFSIDDILQKLSSLNLACGFHGGDPLIIKTYAKLAHKYNCNIGAHPSFPDLQGFGNRYMDLSSPEIKAMLQYQIGALEGILNVYGLEVQHVKCHGALYNRSMVDETLAKDIIDGIAEYRESLTLIVPPKSAIEYIADLKGINYKLEIFADREYESNGELVSRREANAMITNPSVIAERVLKVIQEEKIKTIDGTILEMKADTICFHIDTPGSNEILEQTINLLKYNNISLNK